jgi:predicted DsbA family dithiol-disulfide isomerase
VETSPDPHTEPTADRPVVTVEIYSDVVCPWCYIGKRRFEGGMQLLNGDDLGVDFEVLFRPFQLDPTAAPGVAGPVVDAYARKFGGPERAAEIIDHVTRVASDSGLDFHMERAQRANTLLAHRLIWLAEQPGSPVPQEALKERLLRAYFVDGVHIGDPEALADCAAEIGFDRDTVVEFLASDRGASEVAALLDDAREQGITAVPTYVFDGAWAVPGAQEPEMFAQILRKMAAKVIASVTAAIDEHVAVDG